MTQSQTTRRPSARDETRLIGVHPALVAVVRLAMTTSSVPFFITEGLRSADRQKALLKAGATQTLNSRHLTGHAVDVAALIDGEVRWDWPLYPRIAGAFKAAAEQLNTPIVWGGDWKTLKDGPHFELDRKRYP
jgi:peptidoglycan L-alanyl-D-glutamate endopeptidase CwlK